MDHTTRNNEGRLLGAYVRSMIRAEDAADAVTIEDFDGVKALAFHETIDDEAYVTWLYSYDGQLYEQFTDADRAFEPESGSVICPAERFEPVLADGLLTVNLVDGAGAASTVQVGLRCAR